MSTAVAEAPTTPKRRRGRPSRSHHKAAAGNGQATNPTAGLKAAAPVIPDLQTQVQRAVTIGDRLRALYARYTGETIAKLKRDPRPITEAQLLIWLAASTTDNERLLGMIEQKLGVS